MGKSRTPTTAATSVPVLDVDVAVDPLPGDALHELLRSAREQRVVRCRVQGIDAYLITGYEDIREFFGAHQEFPGGVSYQVSTLPVVGDTFINMDGPAHDLYRQLATPAFRSRATARFVDEQLTPLAHEVIDRFAGRGEG